MAALSSWSLLSPAAAAMRAASSSWVSALTRARVACASRPGGTASGPASAIAAASVSRMRTCPPRTLVHSCWVLPAAAEKSSTGVLVRAVARRRPRTYRWCRTAPRRCAVLAVLRGSVHSVGPGLPNSDLGSPGLRGRPRTNRWGTYSGSDTPAFLPVTRYQRGGGRWQRVHRATCLAGRFGLLSVGGAGENDVAGSENRFCRTSPMHSAVTSTHQEHRPPGDRTVPRGEFQDETAGPGGRWGLQSRPE